MTNTQQTTQVRDMLPADYWPNGYACPKGTPGCGLHNHIHIHCDVSSEMARRYRMAHA